MQRAGGPLGNRAGTPTPDQGGGKFDATRSEVQQGCGDPCNNFRAAPRVFRRLGLISSRPVAALRLTSARPLTDLTPDRQTAASVIGKAWAKRQKAAGPKTDDLESFQLVGTGGFEPPTPTMST